MPNRKKPPPIPPRLRAAMANLQGRKQLAIGPDFVRFAASRSGKSRSYARHEWAMRFSIWKGYKAAESFSLYPLDGLQQLKAKETIESRVLLRRCAVEYESNSEQSGRHAAARIDYATIPWNLVEFLINASKDAWRKTSESECDHMSRAMFDFAARYPDPKPLAGAPPASEAPIQCGLEYRGRDFQCSNYTWLTTGDARPAIDRLRQDFVYAQEQCEPIRPLKNCIVECFEVRRGLHQPVVGGMDDPQALLAQLINANR
jgi:hypothetical protein